MPRLGIAALHEFQARRGIKKEVSHRDHCTFCHAAGLHLFLKALDDGRRQRRPVHEISQMREEMNIRQNIPAVAVPLKDLLPRRSMPANVIVGT